jgi:hypothetical protein
MGLASQVFEIGMAILELEVKMYAYIHSSYIHACIHANIDGHNFIYIYLITVVIRNCIYD